MWERVNFTFPVGFPLITQKRLILQPWHFATFSNILIETFVPNLVFLTCPSLQIVGKTQTEVFPISEFLVNCHNSRTSCDIDMKLGLVTKFEKRSKATSKKFDNDIMSDNFDVIDNFSIYNQSGAMQKPDSRCINFKTYIFLLFG